VDAGHVRVSFEIRDSVCFVKVSGELTQVSEREFAARTDEALAVFRGPILFDLSGLTFLDRHGARALARTLAAAPPRRAGLHGCSPAVGQVLSALGFDLTQAPGPALEIAAGGSAAEAAAPSRGETLTALARASHANARQSAAHAGEVMSRLAATYVELALNSRYRAESKSADRGQLLARSARALDLSRQYLRHAASSAT
jgi:anti-anti-sigma regulatory factor